MRSISELYDLPGAWLIDHPHDQHTARKVVAGLVSAAVLVVPSTAAAFPRENPGGVGQYPGGVGQYPAQKAPGGVGQYPHAVPRKNPGGVGQYHGPHGGSTIKE